MITQEDLKSEVSYDPESGIFTSNKKKGNRSKGFACGSVWAGNGGKSYIQISVFK